MRLFSTQIFGGYGFMNEFPVGRLYRDAKILEIGEGTSECSAWPHHPRPRCRRVALPLLVSAAAGRVPGSQSVYE